MGDILDHQKKLYIFLYHQFITGANNDIRYQKELQSFAVPMSSIKFTNSGVSIP
jgi:hypothetical protein